MRDKLQSEEYYEKYLKHENTLISNKIEKLNNTSDDSVKVKILINLGRCRLNVFEASFSSGSNKKQLNSLLKKLVDDIVKINEITYDVLLEILSFCVILDNKECANTICDKFEKAYDDSIIQGLISFMIRDKLDWGSGNLSFKDDYSLLYKVVTAPNDKRTKALCEYIEFWEKENINIFKSSKIDDSNYTGFWCFESAAFSEIFKLDKEEFKKYKSFPVL